MLITSYKIGGVHFRLFGMNGFHVQAKKFKSNVNDNMSWINIIIIIIERFTAASSRCRQNLKYENFTSSFGRPNVKTLHQQACLTCSTITFLHSTNEIIDLWRCHWRCRLQMLNSLLSVLHPTFWSLFSLPSVSSTNQLVIADVIALVIESQWIEP